MAKAKPPVAAAPEPARIPGPVPPPVQRSFSSSMRVDAVVSDWRAELAPETSREAQERELYGKAWEAYLEGDYGFGLWCWLEVDRLILALGGSLREANRVLGPGRYLGFSHRKAIAAALPVEKIYRPRKGDMSTPRPDAILLPTYQALAVYAVRAQQGAPRDKAQYEIALGEYAERRRADPYGRYFESFRTLLEKEKEEGSAPSTTG
ncbi:MAG: hypothetical protein L3K13_07585 [Thermoplasmata archaeon]|nr:hypothetical protein [Thermoplasmata archaeon]